MDDPYKWFLRNEPTLNLERPKVDPETGLRFTYRNIGVTRNAKPEDQKRMRVILDPVPHVILDQHIPLRGWYKAKHEPATVRPRPCYTEALLTQPYGGFCPVGCGYCYINNGIRGYRSQGITVVDPSYPAKVAKQLDKMQIAAAVYLSSFVEPFLPLEDVYHITQQTAEAAVSRGLPIFFLTRMKLPGWAFDLLKQNPHSYQQFSINTPDPEDWVRLSPRALPLPDLIDQIRACRKQGIYVSIQVNPIISGITSPEQICELIHILAQAGANHLIFKFVEIVYTSANAMMKAMVSRFGKDRGGEFGKLFTQNIGGVRTIAEEYRIAALDSFSRECSKAGVTMSLCYEYEYQRDSSGKIVNKTGVSLGPKYTTSAQCHGHRVPIYVRKGDRFVPLACCPDGGCLYCADKRKKGVPCKDSRLGEARALAPADLNVFEGKGGKS